MYNKKTSCSPECARKANRERWGLTMVHDPKNCIICGKEFIPKNRVQVTCGNSECQKVMRTQYKYTKRNGEIAALHKYRKKKRMSTEEWNALTPSERWERMTLPEVSAACNKCRISYGKAQTMRQMGTLPEDFGRKE